jgi:hypothetical protein
LLDYLPRLKDGLELFYINAEIALVFIESRTIAPLSEIVEIERRGLISCHPLWLIIGEYSTLA